MLGFYPKMKDYTRMIPRADAFRFSARKHPDFIAFAVRQQKNAAWEVIRIPILRSEMSELVKNLRGATGA